MKRNRLMASIALGLFAAAGAAQAADGWYVAPAVGYYNSDEDRLTEEGSVFGALGIGKYFGNNANTLALKGFTLVDAQASWRLGQGDLIVRGKNLTDAFYVEWAATANQMLVGMPRVVEVSYQFRF